MTLGAPTSSSPLPFFVDWAVSRTAEPTRNEGEGDVEGEGEP